MSFGPSDRQAARARLDSDPSNFDLPMSEIATRIAWLRYALDALDAADIEVAELTDCLAARIAMLDERDALLREALADIDADEYGNGPLADKIRAALGEKTDA